MNKHFIHCLLALFVIFAGLAPSTAWSAISFGTGVQYDSFSSDQTREKGSQVTSPVTASVGGGGFFGGLASGYVSSTYRPAAAGADDVTVSTFLDTTISLSYSRPIGGACLQVGSSFNLPTGDSSLDADERQAEMDSRYGELVSVTDFGAGTNANPGFAIAIPIKRLIIGGGFSYNILGAYVPSSEIDGDDVDPGDQFLGKISLGWDGKLFKVIGGVKYQWIFPDEIGGEEVFKEGDMVGGNVKLSFKAASWNFTLEGAYTTWFKGKRFTGDQELLVEELRRFGDDLTLRAKVSYRVWPTLKLKLIGRGRWVQDNEYPETSAFYDAGRNTYSILGGFSYSLHPWVSLNFNVTYLTVEEGADASFAQATDYQGFKTALSIDTVLF